MPATSLHLEDGTDVLLDPEGIEIPDQAVAAQALWSGLSGNVRFPPIAD